MECQNDKDSKKTSLDGKEKPVIPINFIARIVGIRAPDAHEGMNTIIEFELHTSTGYRGRFNIPYRPEVGRLGTAYQANILLKEISLEDYVRQRPESRHKQPILDGNPPPGVV